MQLLSDSQASSPFLGYRVVRVSRPACSATLLQLLFNTLPACPLASRPFPPRVPSQCGRMFKPRGCAWPFNLQLGSGHRRPLAGALLVAALYLSKLQLRAPLSWHCSCSERSCCLVQEEAHAMVFTAFDKVRQCVSFYLNRANAWWSFNLSIHNLAVGLLIQPIHCQGHRCGARLIQNPANCYHSL